MTTCKDCLFYEENNPESGTCKRYPPTTLMVPQQNAIGEVQMIAASAQPGVEVNRTACGEFEHVESPDIIQ